MIYETILTAVEGPVAVITLNRPQAMNALNSKLMDELTHAVDAFEKDQAIRCLILAGSEKAFAAESMARLLSVPDASAVLRRYCPVATPSADRLGSPVVAPVVVVKRNDVVESDVVK